MRVNQEERIALLFADVCAPFLPNLDLGFLCAELRRKYASSTDRDSYLSDSSRAIQAISVELKIEHPISGNRDCHRLVNQAYDLANSLMANLIFWEDTVGSRKPELRAQVEVSWNEAIEAINLFSARCKWNRLNQWLAEKINKQLPELAMKCCNTGGLKAAEPVEALQQSALGYSKRGLMEVRLEYTLPAEVESISGNVENIRRLNELLKTPLGVVPFVGAGLSMAYGMPGWTPFLKRLAKDKGQTRKVADLLMAGNYEEAAQFLEDEMTPFRFHGAIERDFGDHNLEGKVLTGAALYLPRLASGVFLTTNFDRVLERVAKQVQSPFETVIVGAKTDAAGRTLRLGRRGLVKLHGDWEERTERVLTKAEYDAHYGVNSVDLSKKLPRLLHTILVGRSLLFIGCSLNQDRTIATIGDVAKVDQAMVHFAVVETPKTTTARKKTELFLGQHNILPIWYPHDRYDLIEPLLAYLTNQRETAQNP